MSFREAGNFKSKVPACNCAELSEIDFHLEQLVCNRPNAALVLAPDTPSAGPGSNPTSFNRTCSCGMSSGLNVCAGRVGSETGDVGVTLFSAGSTAVLIADLSESVSELSDMTQPVIATRQKATIKTVLFTHYLLSLQIPRGEQVMCRGR